MILLFYFENLFPALPPTFLHKRTVCVTYIRSIVKVFYMCDFWDRDSFMLQGKRGIKEQFVYLHLFEEV